MDKKNLEKLRTSKRGAKCFTDISNFDIFENPIYVDKFFYQKMDQRFENKTSDYITKSFYPEDN